MEKMRSIEDKGCVNNGTSQEISAGGSCMSFDFRNRTSHHRTALGKPTPSKWDDAQKWLVNLSRGEKNQAKASPRNSNADDRRLIVPVPKKDYSSDDEEATENGCPRPESVEVETKNVDCDESVWRINKHVNSSKSVVRSICVRDMGTEMTPIASQEPSRTGTPIRARTPAVRSPVRSESSTPVQNGVVIAVESDRNGVIPVDRGGEGIRGNGSNGEFGGGGEVVEKKSLDESRKMNPLENQALAWDEAERAKYMARYKREEVKIQAWENHQKRKAEMEMRKIEVKAERLKSRAQEKYTNKLASTRRIAEEKRANAEAKLNEKAVKTSEMADYIRRTGHLPSAFSFKLPSWCW